MNCTFEPTGEVDELGRKKYQCSREECQQPTGWTFDGPDRIWANCKVPDPNQPDGWGDKVAGWLSWFGITQARMEVIGWTCNCAERQAILNQVGWELADRWRWLTQLWSRVSFGYRQDTQDK